MKPYRTSFLRVATLMVLVCSLSFVHSQSAKASDCGFTISTADTAWFFSAIAGGSQSRSLVITNTSGAEITLSISTGSDAFGVNHTQITIPKSDSNLSTYIIITFKPGANATGNLFANLKITKLNTDCSKTLYLVGTVTAGNNGGGDKVVIMEPSSAVFGPVAVGEDSCHVFYLVNHTGAQVKIESLKIVGSDAFTINPAFNGGAMDSGGHYQFTVCFKGSAANSRILDSIVAVCSYGTGLHTIYGTLLGYTSTPPPPVILVADPHEFTFGTVEFGTQSCKDVVVTNKTKTPVVIRNWTKCDNTDFTISPAFTGADTLAAGASMTFTICYKPHEAHIYGSCTLAISYLQPDPISDGSISINLSGNSVTDSNIVHTAVCLKTEQGSSYHDAIVIGGTAEHTLQLINNTNHSITINSIAIDPQVSPFTITSTLPITVPANSSNMTLTYTFAPTSNNNGTNMFTAYALMSLSGDSIQCHDIKGVLIGFVAHSNITLDSTIRPLYPEEHRTLGIEGNGKSISSTFYFTNNLTVDVTVTKIYLDDNTYFSISSYTPTPTPFVLHPGDNMQVVITLTATDNIVHHAHLIIDANHNLQSQSFDLQGLNQAAASVPNALPSGVAINVSPNPASSYVNVDMAGIRSADIQVIDLLGNIATTAKANTTWKWDATNFVSGSYIVRIAGTSTTGEQFTASKRVIVSK